MSEEQTKTDNPEETQEQQENTDHTEQPAIDQETINAMSELITGLRGEIAKLQKELASSKKVNLMLATGASLPQEPEEIIHNMFNGGSRK